MQSCSTQAGRAEQGEEELQKDAKRDSVITQRV